MKVCIEGCKVFIDDLVKRSTAAADSLAMDAALSAVVDIEWILSEPVPECFGAKWLSRITVVKQVGSPEYERVLYDYAVRSFVYAKHHAAAFLKCAADRNPDDWLHRHLLTPDGYADYEGWASTLYTHLGSNKADVLFDELDYPDFGHKPTSAATLDAMAVVWFYQAAREYKENSALVFDVLHEVSDSLSLAGFVSGWDGGGESAKSEASSRQAETARAGGLAKNKPHNDAREKLVGIWKSGSYKTRTDCVDSELSDLITYCGKRIAYKTAIGWLTGIEKD